MKYFNCNANHFLISCRYYFPNHIICLSQSVLTVDMLFLTVKMRQGLNADQSEHQLCIVSIVFFSFSKMKRLR